MAKYRVENRRTRRATHDMIMAMAKYGDHYFDRHYGYTFKTDADVKRFFVNAIGKEYRDAVEEYRDKDAQPPFENLLSGGWTVNAGGGVASFTDETGEEHIVAQGDESGWYHPSAYAALFETAVDDLHRAMDTGSYMDFLSCTSNGVASVEAYITSRVRVHNSRHPNDQLVDSGSNQVRFETKVKEWIPRMTEDRSLDRNTPRWAHFKELRDIRNRGHQHVQAPILGSDYRKLGKLMNLFRTGIAGMILDLHIHFRSKNTPSKVIRYAYLPDIEYIPKED